MQLTLDTTELQTVTKRASAVVTSAGHRIRSIAIIGGFLDGAHFDLADGLNCVIGGRGTGKSTMVELARYALDDLLARELRCRDATARYVRRSADELAKAVGAMGGVTTITGCVRVLRRNITTRLRKHLNIDVHPEDVIGHDEQGYYLQDSIVVRDAGDSVDDVPAVVPAAPADAPGHGGSDAAPADLNERRQWVLRELQRGTRVRRAMLERKFDVADKTAKRDLADLTSRGAVEFVREGREGYYRLGAGGQG